MLSEAKERKTLPYLSGLMTFPDGATAKVVLWHYKPRKKEDAKEEVKT